MHPMSSLWGRAVFRGITMAQRALSINEGYYFATHDLHLLLILRSFASHVVGYYAVLLQLTCSEPK